MLVNELYLDFGANTALANNTIGIIRRPLMSYGVLLGNFRNNGDYDVTLTMGYSATNLNNAAYTDGLTFRVAGAGVATLLIKPRAEVEFVLEWVVAFAASPFLRFIGTPPASTPLTRGLIALCQRQGPLDNVGRYFS